MAATASAGPRPLQSPPRPIRLQRQVRRLSVGAGGARLAITPPPPCSISTRAGHQGRAITPTGWQQAPRLAQESRRVRAGAGAEPSAVSPEDGGRGEGSQPGDLELRLGHWCSAAAQLFPVWVVLGAALALLNPSWFLWFTGDWVVWGLALTMIGMGTSLEAEDFRRLLATPWTIALGVLLQYTVMPGLGAALAHFAGLPKAFAVGLVLVACCPGGTASNIVSFLAKADVALSVGMTTVSTLLAAFTTPLLTKLAVGAIVPVDVLALFKSTLQVVLLPVAIGALLNRFFPKQVVRTRPFSPIVAVLTVALICASVVANQQQALLSCGPTLLLCVFCLHFGGFALGYLLPKVLRLPESSNRTISIEVGMQNSTLGSMLAAVHFAFLPGAAAPGAISACMHSVLGSMAAGWWRWQDSQKKAAAPSSPEA